MWDLRGNVCVVTGASRGVGRGIARVLGECQATVYVTGRSVRGRPTTDQLPGTIDETAELVTEAGGQGIALRCDHTDDAQVEALFRRVKNDHGRLDLLVNNVWGGYEQYDSNTFDAPFWEQPLDRWQGMFVAGVRAHFTASRFAAPLMLSLRRGLIINISFGDRRKYLGSLLYDLSKAAIDRLAFGMAHELREYQIAAVALYPGFVRTERVMGSYGGDLSVTQSPQYTGRAVAALAADPEVMKRSGQALSVGDVAQEYNFTDIDGRQLPPFRLPD